MLRDANRLGELAELLGQFDEVIFEEVANSRIRSLIDNLRAHLTRIGQLTTEIPGRIAASVEEHARIVDAIANRNPDAAERAMRDHIRSVLTDQLEAGVHEKEAATASPQA
jgi:DNA-binding FadR family transcriptional regulator